MLFKPVFQSMPSVPLQHTAVKKQKMSLAEKRATMHGVQTYLSDEDYELRLRQKKSCEEILRDALKQYIQAFK